MIISHNPPSSSSLPYQSIISTHNRSSTNHQNQHNQDGYTVRIEDSFSSYSTTNHNHINEEEEGGGGYHILGQTSTQNRNPDLLTLNGKTMEEPLIPA